ncbi:MAG: hypothetical protein KIT16_02385 [Rhodospirillaceae bacterium]|nr:hypothetical protein [Rhodospirillaceae bacterium]
MSGTDARVIDGIGQSVDARGWTAALATLAGGLLLVAVGLLSLLIVADIFGRYALNHPVIDGERYGAVETYFGLGLAALSLLALPEAIAATFLRRGEPPVRSRSALVLVPGCLLAVVLGIAAFALLTAEAPPGIPAMAMAQRTITEGFARYVFLFFPILVVLAAVLGGARSPEATAALVAPALLCGLFGFIGEFSIASTFVAFAPLAVAAGLLLAILYAFAPARAVTPWVAGPALAAGMAVPLALGLLTPTETAGLFACFGFIIALPVRCLALRHRLGPMLRQAGTELAAVVFVFAAAMIVALDISLLIGRQPGLLASLPPQTALLVGAAVFFVLALVATPMLVIAAAAVPIVQAIRSFGVEPIWIGTLLTLFGLSAIALRALRGKYLAAASGGLPAPAALFAAVVFAGLGALVALVPNIVLGPVRAMLG